MWWTGHNLNLLYRSHFQDCVTHFEVHAFTHNGLEGRREDRKQRRKETSNTSMGRVMGMQITNTGFPKAYYIVISYELHKQNLFYRVVEFK